MLQVEKVNINQANKEKDDEQIKLIDKGAMLSMQIFLQKRKIKVLTTKLSVTSSVLLAQWFSFLVKIKGNIIKISFRITKINTYGINTINSGSPLLLSR